MIARAHKRIAKLHWAIKILIWFVCIVSYVAVDVFLFQRYIAPMFGWDIPDILFMGFGGSIAVSIVYFLFSDNEALRSEALETAPTCEAIYSFEHEDPLERNE